MAHRFTYIAGPMSGYEDHNFPAFHVKAAQERAKGYDVINPAELDEDAGDLTQPWDFYLRRDIRLLADCDRIVLLEGWDRSHGANLEVSIAMALGFEIVHPDGTVTRFPPAGERTTKGNK